MSFVISTIASNDLNKKECLFFKGERKNYLRFDVFFKGEIFGCSWLEALRMIEKGGSQSLKKLRGSYFLVWVRRDSGEINIATDHISNETLFYYYYPPNIIISDDFWEIVNILEPDEDAIDIEVLREFVVLPYPLNNRTILKHVHFFPPATFGRFDFSNKTLELSKYWQFSLHEKKYGSLVDALDSMGHALDTAFLTIKKAHDSNTVYGVGLSGGLDSRIIPHYALKHDMKIKSFIIGKKRANGILLSNDHKKARLLAAQFGLRNKEMEIDSEPYEIKSYYDVRHFPMGSSEILKTVRRNLPQFDVLIHGTTQMLIISHLPRNLNTFKKEKLVESLFFKYGTKYMSRSRAAILLNDPFRLLRKRQMSSDDVGITGIIDKNAINGIKERISEFVEQNSSKSNYEIWHDYAIQNLGSKGKYGAFESLQGLKKSYSIYYPFLLDEILSWQPVFCEERKIIKEFLTQRLPYLAKVGSQNGNVPLLHKNSPSEARRLFTKTLFYARGKGVTGYSRWVCSKDFRHFSQEVFKRDSEVFNKTFQFKDVGILALDYPNVYLKLIKLKQILELIETKAYRVLFYSANHEDRECENFARFFSKADTPFDV